MRKARTPQAGFSLIELLMVVAILGILAAVAIPSFQRVQLRSRASEGRTNLAAIRTSEAAYFAESGTYVASAPTPLAIPGSGRQPWPTGSGFDLLGWAPTGSVQFQYAVTLPAGDPALVFTAEAISDLDGDGTLNIFGYVKEDSAGGGAVAGIHCPDTGVWDQVTLSNALYDTVGPCDSNSGLSAF